MLSESQLMEPIVSRLDITTIFCEVDDFCQWFEQAWSQQPQLPSMPVEKGLSGAEKS